MTREEAIRKTLDTVLWTRNASDDNKNILTDALIKALEQEPNSDIRLNSDKNELNRVKNELEPTTKNDLALIRTEGLDEEIRCTMCTNHMRSDRGCDGSCVVNEKMYKAVMDAIEKRTQSTTKNDLGVDWDELKRKIFMEVDGGTDDKWLRYADVCDNISNSIDEFKADLSSVIPQEPRKGNIEYNELEGCYECSECKNAISEYYSFCPNCGADIRAESEQT